MPQKLITVLMPSANALWVPLRPVVMRWRSKLFPLDGQCTADPAGQRRDRRDDHPRITHRSRSCGETFAELRVDMRVEGTETRRTS